MFSSALEIRARRKGTTGAFGTWRAVGPVRGLMSIDLATTIMRALARENPGWEFRLYQNNKEIGNLLDGEER